MKNLLITSIAIVLIISLSKCSPLLHNFYKIQSDKRLRLTENLNFLGEKALTQWWYFDFFFEDGSVLVLLFAPYHWWNDQEKGADPKSLIYLSYLRADGELIRAKKIFDSNEVYYDEKSLICPYLEICKSHDGKTREYTINFFLDEIKGSAKIISNSKAFSPLPTGSIGTFGTRHILKQKGKGLAYRYAAHVPQGDVICNLDINDNHLNLSGKAYHEQGWFTGQAHQMGDGWVWFHFVSKSINLFGARSFFYLEMNGEPIIGGLNSFDSRSVLSDTIFANSPRYFVLGGKLDFSSSKTSFDVTPIGKTSTPLVCIPALDTDQIWGTVLQPSRIRINRHGKELQEEGMMLLETSRMRK